MARQRYSHAIIAMQLKDEALYREICRMQIIPALTRWQERYPEDFKDVKFTPTYPG